MCAEDQERLEGVMNFDRTLIPFAIAYSVMVREGNLEVSQFVEQSSCYTVRSSISFVGHQHHGTSDLHVRKTVGC